MTEDELRPSRTPAELEAYLADRLSGRRLVCEVVLDEDVLQEVRMLWRFWRNGSAWVPGEIARFYPAVHLFFLVDHGIRHYDGNDFWSRLNVSASDQRRIGQGFESALSKFGLEEFPQFYFERARRFVSVILAHGGIPASMAERFVEQDLLPAIRAGAEQGVDAVADWRTSHPAFFPRPIARFLLQGGAPALDLLDRLIELAWAPRADAEAVAARLKIPKALAAAIMALPAAASLTRGVALPRARVTFDPYGGVGPQLVLPPLDREVAPRVAWQIDSGHGAIQTQAGFHRAQVDPIELAPKGEWWTASVRLDGRIARTDRFEAFAENPVVCFDEGWNYVVDYAGIRLDTIWIVAETGFTFASVEAGGMREMTGDQLVLRGEWRAYSATRLELAGVATLAVIDGKGDEVCRLVIDSVASEPAILDHPLDDVISQLGDPVFARLPHVTLPPGRPWSIQVADPAGSVREVEFSAAAEPRSVDLAAAADTTTGRFDVTVQGALGVGKRFSFALVPGLNLEGPAAPVSPQTGTVVVHATADPDVALHGLRPGLTAEIEVAAGDSREELWARSDRHKVGLFVLVPRLRWAFRDEARNDPPAQTIVPFTPADITGSDRQAVVVSVGRAEVFVTLALEAAGEQVQQEGPKRTGQSGQATFPLDDFRDSVRANEGNDERFVVVTTAGRFEIARYAAPRRARAGADSRVGRDVAGTITRVTATRVEVAGEDWHGIAYIEFLAGPISDYQVGDDVKGFALSEDDRGLKLDLRPFEPGRFPPGAQVRGVVRFASPQGLRVALDGHDGIIFAEQLPQDRPWTTWKVGEELSARANGIDRARRRIKLSMVVFDDHGLRRGSPVIGSVTGVSDDRIFVTVDGAPGFIRPDEWEGAPARAGATFAGWVERVRRERGELEISCRRFNRLGLRTGDTVDVTAVGAADGRLVVMLGDGETAIVPPEELPPHLRPDDLARKQAPLQVIVTRLDQASRNITASVARAITSYTFGDEDDRPNPFAVIGQSERDR